MLAGPLVLVALGSVTAPLLAAGLVLLAAAIALIVLDARSAPGAAQVRVEREIDPLLSVGRPNRVLLRVTAPAGARLTVRDDVPLGVDPAPLLHQVVGTGVVSYTVTPPARGQVALGQVHVRAEGPWRMAMRDLRCAGPVTVRVDPDIAAVRVYEALARRGQLQELGVRAQLRLGDGGEFERIREAVPDDPPHRISWAATARTARLMAVQVAPERAQPVIACVDHGRLMGVGAGALTKLDHALNAALLLLHVVLRSGDRAGMVAFTDRLDTVVEPRAGAAQLRRLLESMAPLQPVEMESDYTAALGAMRLRQRRRALLVIFTDVVDPDQVAALAVQCRHLRTRHLPLVVAVRDPAVEDLARQRPRDGDAVYTRAVASGIVAQRQDALLRLRAAGVDTIDADARALSPRLVNRYLELKRRAVL